MRKLLLLILLLVLVSGVNAQSNNEYLYEFSFTETLAADSSDTLAKYDTVITDWYWVGNWDNMSTDWDIYSVDTDFTTQYFFIQMQTNRDIDGYGEWVDVGGASALDTIEPGATDTTRYAVGFVLSDSVWNYVRFQIIKKDSLADTEGQDLAGNEYDYYGRIYLMRKP